MKETSSRLKDDLNIVKLIQNIRDFKCLLGNSILTPMMKVHLRHSKKNLITIDDSEHEKDVDDPDGSNYENLPVPSFTESRVNRICT